MCNEGIISSPSAISFVPECCKTQEMYIKSVDTCSFVFGSVSEKFKIREIWDKAIDNFLPILKFLPDWYVTSKML